MSRAREILREAQAAMFQNYRSFPLVIARGEGCRLWDADGNRYLDFVAGIAVVNLGHCHPAVVGAVRDAAGRLFHVSNLYVNENAVNLARWLVEHSFADRVFFCNSGTEAVEAAIKLVRRHAWATGRKQARKIVVAENGFHGRTMGALSATMQAQYHEGFEPMLPGFAAVPYNDAEALRRAVDDETCAVLLEPVQGEGGVIPATREYLRAARAICDERGIPLALDEIQTGMGRTGTLFAYEHFGIEPDVMVLSKALGNGFPIGALLAREAIAECFTPGTHGATFGGGPLACAAALATCETLAREVLPGVPSKAAYFRKQLVALAAEFPIMKEVRGIGLHLAIETDADCNPIVEACIPKGLLANVIQGKVLRFIPPLVITQTEIDEGVGTLRRVLQDRARS